MTFENVHGLCMNSAADCKECALGDYSRISEPQWWTPSRHGRCIGSGRQGAPVMLVGEMPSDVSKRYGVHSYRMAATARELVDQWEFPLVHALQMFGFAPALIYGTTALKCEAKARVGKRQRILPGEFVETCREYHLGVEIEAMQPAVIWITGTHAADGVRRHFGMEASERLPTGGMLLMDAPEIWTHEKVLLIRTPHPASNHRKKLIDYMAYIDAYVERFVYG